MEKYWLFQENRPYVPKLGGGIPKGFPGEGRRFSITFNDRGGAVVDEEIAHYLFRMKSANLRMTAADPSEPVTFQEFK